MRVFMCLVCAWRPWQWFRNKKQGQGAVVYRDKSTYEGDWVVRVFLMHSYWRWGWPCHPVVW